MDQVDTQETIAEARMTALARFDRNQQQQQHEQ
jgi:hypothetical protein